MEKCVVKGFSAVLIGTLLLIPRMALAQVPSLFATFSQQNSTPSFDFLSSGGVGTFGLASAIPVNFQYQTANGFGAAIGQNIPAKLTMSSSTAGPAFNDSGILVQPLQNIEMRFTSASAAPDSGDLLHVFLTTGNFIGQPGGQTGVLTGTQSATSSSVVNFASQYLDFSVPLVNKNFAVSFTSVDPTLGIGGDGNLSPFMATGTGNFGSAPKPGTKAIPEPGTLALAGLGILALTVRKRR